MHIIIQYVKLWIKNKIQKMNLKAIMTLPRIIPH